MKFEFVPSSKQYSPHHDKRSSYKSPFGSAKFELSYNKRNLESNLNVLQ